MLLDSLDLLRKPCTNHCSGLPTLTRKKRTRWRHRGKRGGRRLNARPIPVHISCRSQPSVHRVVNRQRTVIPITFSSLNQQGARARFALWNARSVANKTAPLCDFIISAKVDILAITESWLNGDSRDDHIIADLYNTLPDYISYSIPRLNRSGGGVLLLLRSGFKVTQHVPNKFSSFEHGDFTISSHSTSVRLVIIYRAPNSKKNNATPGMFFAEFSTL